MAKLTYGDKTLFRALFRGLTMSCFKRSPVPECQYLTESQQFDLVERAVKCSRELAKSSSDKAKLEVCSNCSSAALMKGAADRVFCSLWKVSCLATASCPKFDKAARSVLAMRELFPNEVPQSGDLYPDYDKQLVEYKGLAKDWEYLASHSKWRTRRQAPAGWELVVAAEFNPVLVGDVILWDDTTTNVGRVSQLTTDENAKWFTKRAPSSRKPDDSCGFTIWRRQKTTH